MKKIISWIFIVFAASASYGAESGAISRALPSATANNDADASARTTATAAAGSARSTSRTTVRRDVGTATTVPATGTVSARTTTRGTTAATPTPTRSVTPSRGAAARTAAGGEMSVRDNLDAAVNTVGRNARVTAASVNSDPAVRRAGMSLRPSTAEVGGRATIAGTNIQTGSNIGESVRALQSRAASTTTQRETISEAKERLEQTAELNKSCQEQYNDCMDQFCAVIDNNQKRCSCSANLARYTKVESAVKDANTQLNDVAQRIRYVGLSADEIRAIMSATEAEEALSGARDTTETRSMLEDIEALIKNPASTTTGGTDTYSTLDLNLDFSDTSDMFNLDFLNNNSGSLSNLRGADLYNAAKKRCNTILTQCKDAGATSQQITANYDLAIDKDCIAYEQGLTKMNETLVSNVRSANLMLQKARLAVLQNKNEYDAKGCIAALDSCMTDEMVCGEDYVKCLDPTKKYIDENGKVVLGQDITDILSFMKKYDNSNIKTEFLQSAAQRSISGDACAKSVEGEAGGGDGWCAVKYLLQKIGTGVRVTDGGLCRAVLDKCQRYTYDSNNKYQPYNDVVVNYIQRAMVNIKSGQSKVISDYASSCMVDVATCYNQQVTQVNAWSSSANVSSIRKVMSGACRNVALTCGYAIFGEVCESGTNSNLNKVGTLSVSGEVAGQDTKPVGPPSVLNPGTLQPGNAGQTSLSDLINAAVVPEDCSDNGIIEEISTMFYNSMLCPDNSTYTGTTKEQADEADKSKYVNDLCVCNTNYEPWGGQCMNKCPTDAENGAGRNSYGTCTCKTGYTYKNGVCTENTTTQ